MASAIQRRQRSAPWSVLQTCLGTRTRVGPLASQLTGYPQTYAPSCAGLAFGSLAIPNPSLRPDSTSHNFHYSGQSTFEWFDSVIYTAMGVSTWS